MARQLVRRADVLVENFRTGTQVAHPIHYSAFTPATPTPPPGLGEHDTEVRRWLDTAQATESLTNEEYA